MGLFTSPPPGVSKIQNFCMTWKLVQLLRVLLLQQEAEETMVISWGYTGIYDV